MGFKIPKMYFSTQEMPNSFEYFMSETKSRKPKQMKGFVN